MSRRTSRWSTWTPATLRGATDAGHTRRDGRRPAPPSEVADVPVELDSVLLTALATEKAERYDTVVYLRDELQEIFE